MPRLTTTQIFGLALALILVGALVLNSWNSTTQSALEEDMLARQIAIGFGIAAIFPLLVFYGVSTFYPAPKFPDNYDSTQCMMRAVTPEQRVECTKMQQAAQETYRAAAKEFSWRLIIVATPLGLVAILVGAYLTFYAIGTGLILGGIISVAFGYWGYWQYIENWARLVSLLLGFAILLFLGCRGVAGSRSASR